MDRKRREDYYDFSLLAVIILLTGFGLVMLYSTTSYTASLKYGNDMYFFSRQAKYSLIAIVLAVLLSRVNYRILWYLSRVIYILALVLMALVQSPLGRAYNGARRWLAFGPVRFQPAEVAKIAVIVYLPVMIVRMGRNLRGWRPMAKLLAAGAIQAAAARIFTQNLSTALIIMLIALTIIFVAWPKTKGFLIAAAVTAGLAAAFVLIIAGAGSSGGNFRFMRIRVWLHPEQHTESGGYQVMQALYALGSGGIFGKGLGNGTQKLGAVPEAENDMIFSIICEDLGIFGGIIVISLFLYLIYRLFFIAQNAPERTDGDRNFCAYLASGDPQSVRESERHSDDRRDAAVRELRRHIRLPADGRNGGRAVCVARDSFPQAGPGYLGRSGPGVLHRLLKGLDQKKGERCHA